MFIYAFIGISIANARGGGTGSPGLINYDPYSIGAIPDDPFAGDVVGQIQISEPSYEELLALKTLQEQNIVQIESNQAFDKQLESSRLEALRSEAEAKGDARLLGFINDVIYWNEQAELLKKTANVWATLYISIHLLAAYHTFSTALASEGLTVLGLAFSPTQTAWIEQGLSTIGVELIERLIGD